MNSTTTDWAGRARRRRKPKAAFRDRGGPLEFGVLPARLAQHLGFLAGVLPGPIPGDRSRPGGPGTQTVPAVPTYAPEVSGPAHRLPLRSRMRRFWDAATICTARVLQLFRIPHSMTSSPACHRFRRKSSPDTPGRIERLPDGDERSSGRGESVGCHGGGGGCGVEHLGVRRRRRCSWRGRCKAVTLE